MRPSTQLQSPTGVWFLSQLIHMLSITCAYGTHINAPPSLKVSSESAPELETLSNPESKSTLCTGTASRDPKIFTIPPKVQNGVADARFNMSTPTPQLSVESVSILDAPQLSMINSSVFDWWYFDIVSTNDPRETVTVTFFTSTANAFPWLPTNESSVLIAYLWVSFSNGTVFEDYVPATIATVQEPGTDGTGISGVGNWSSTGFSWTSTNTDSSRYTKVMVSSDKLQVLGEFSLTSTLEPHLPCGVTANISTLEVAPHVGWAALVPDAAGSADITVVGSRLQFQGPAYHDKNWSDRPFVASVSSWYWGHGQLGSYSVVWFSYLALNDPQHREYVSSYVARNGTVIASSCQTDSVRVRPIGSSGTSARYPPKAGDVPDGFHLAFNLGADGWLRANVSGTRIAGDGEYYFRWAGHITGEIYEGSSAANEQDSSCLQASEGGSIVTDEPMMSGSAIWEQFVLEE
ncbi:hypothetical protein N7539_004704 [Penicillium diatomitis]|uniref:AttH domain-containing protein n=1 Tax=Penicillium diatomitis TaxID=2819901 RepID=A0A9W9X5Y7_9EURO|nr:uncharacterized protein N7539_004704 [Penicillium diatomitis]KAJ5484716.1 hypothetical protein N7539_004704 [Penicillium diatomitis]